MLYSTLPMPVKKIMHSPVEILWTDYRNALYHFWASRFGTPLAEIRRFPTGRLFSSDKQAKSMMKWQLLDLRTTERLERTRLRLSPLYSNLGTNEPGCETAGEVFPLQKSPNRLYSTIRMETCRSRRGTPPERPFPFAVR
jgi:hypothetical protein